MDDPIFRPEQANEIGLVAIGGKLTPHWLLRAYRSGVFPWFSPGTPLLWWSPDPRGILELHHLHIPRRLQRTLRTGRFRSTLNHAFSAVIRACAERPASETWITPEMIRAYERLHTLGYAHSLEVWCGEELAGGIYGVALGGLFAGESMFTRIRDGSKIALVHLVEHLRARGYVLFDVQVTTEHTTRLGASTLSRRDYLARLQAALQLDVTFT